MAGYGTPDKYLNREQVEEIVRNGLSSVELNGKSVLILIPDGTRTMPMAMFFDIFKRELKPWVKQMDYLVALGTHQPMSDKQLSSLVGQQVINGMVEDIHIYNHEWENPDTFVNLGEIPAQELYNISEERLNQSIPVTLK